MGSYKECQLARERGNCPKWKLISMFWHFENQTQKRKIDVGGSLVVTEEEKREGEGGGREEEDEEG